MPVRIRAEETPLPRCGLGESPRWAYGAWWWVDVLSGEVWTCTDPHDASSAVRALKSGTRTSMVHPAVDRNMAVAVGSTLVLLDVDTHAWTTFATIRLAPDWVLNDGAADQAGTLWIGSVAPTREPGSGGLYRVTSGHAPRLACENLTAMSNGVACMTEGRILHVDSLTELVWEHSTQGTPPRVTATRPWAKLAELRDTMGGFTPGPHTRTRAELDKNRPPQVFPDGLCLDAGGGCWIAVWGLGQVWRVDRGVVTHLVEVPTPQTTSIALGGLDGRDILIMTAHEGMSENELERDPAAGRTFLARSPVAGAPAFLVQP